MYMYMSTVSLSVDARALCKYIFRWLPRPKCFSVKHALCAPYAHFGMLSVQIELWTTTLLSHFNIDRYQVCAHECTFKFYTSDKVGILSNTKYDSFKCCSCDELCEVLTTLIEKIHVQFECISVQNVDNLRLIRPLSSDTFLLKQAFTNIPFYFAANFNVV